MGFVLVNDCWLNWICYIVFVFVPAIFSALWYKPFFSWRRWSTWRLVLKLQLSERSTGRSSAWRMTVSRYRSAFVIWDTFTFKARMSNIVSLSLLICYSILLLPAVLYFLLQVSFLVDEGVSPVLLQLLSCALCGSKVLASSSSSFSGGGSGSAGQGGASQSSQSKSSSKKSKKEDKEKDKEGEATTPAWSCVILLFVEISYLLG